MKKRELTFGEAINEAQIQAMELNKNVFISGLQPEKTGNVFGTCKNILKKFGKKRIFPSPTSEQGITALAAGASINDLRPIIIHERVDFMAYTFDQLANWISLWSFKSAGKSKVPLVIRAMIGKNWGQGPQHGKTLHSSFSYLPGLHVVMPSSPSEAKGLLLSSIMSNDPVIFLEYRALYNTKEHVDKDPYFIELKEPRKRLDGNDITVVAAGAAVLTCLQASNMLKKENINIELIDLRTLTSIKMEKIFNSVKKTKRIMVVEDGWLRGGYGSEIISMVVEKDISLKSLPKRIAWPNSHLPMSQVLEKDYYFTAEDIFKACRDTVLK
ncbi:transketolase C-terminal domain-containing protein [Candidatus Pelagibacter sp.]|nr:transketolase C-terminal domain-containing protein [Candidatus Pelagibacter sp.]